MLVQIHATSGTPIPHPPLPIVKITSKPDIHNLTVYMRRYMNDTGTYLEEWGLEDGGRAGCAQNCVVGRTMKDSLRQLTLSRIVTLVLDGTHAELSPGTVPLASFHHSRFALLSEDPSALFKKSCKWIHTRTRATSSNMRSNKPLLMKIIPTTNLIKARHTTLVRLHPIVHLFHPMPMNTMLVFLRSRACTCQER